MPPIDYADEPRPDRLAPPKLREAIRNFDFPAERDRLVAHARELGAGAGVVDALRDLPARRYETQDDVVATYDEVTRNRA